VVARVGDEDTVKRYHRTGGRIELLAENPYFATILVDPERDVFALEGIGVGLIRAGQGL